MMLGGHGSGEGKGGEFIEDEARIQVDITADG